jgi:hypothetical protein
LSICTIIPYPDKKIAKIANKIKDAISWTADFAIPR